MSEQHDPINIPLPFERGDGLLSIPHGFDADDYDWLLEMLKYLKPRITRTDVVPVPAVKEGETADG